MKIVDVAVFPLRMQGDAPYLGAQEGGGDPPRDRYYVRPPWRSLYAPAHETLIVRMTTDDGIQGWGEALTPVGADAIAGIVRRLLAPTLLGQDPRRIRPLVHGLRQLMRERGHQEGHQADAIAAVDIALFDLVGRATGQRVVDLLGGAFRERVAVYVSGLPEPDDQGRARLAAEWAQRGFDRIKLALGFGVQADLATFDAVMDAVGTGKVAVDAHWAYSLADAERLAAGLDRRGGWFLEAPLVPEDLAGHAELAAKSRIPIAVGEAMRSVHTVLPWLRDRAVDLFQPDVARTGLAAGSDLAALAAAHHVPVAPHHSVGLGIALAAGIHLSAAVPDLMAFEYQPTTLALANRILALPLTLDGNTFTVPHGPGLGVQVDADAIKRYAFDRPAADPPAADPPVADRPDTDRPDTDRPDTDHPKATT